MCALCRLLGVADRYLDWALQPGLRAGEYQVLAPIMV